MAKKNKVKPLEDEVVDTSPEETPVETPAEDTPAVDTPSENAPSGETPTEGGVETPVEGTPSVDTPSENTPSGETPTGDGQPETPPADDSAGGTKPKETVDTFEKLKGIVVGIIGDETAAPDPLDDAEIDKIADSASEYGESDPKEEKE